MLMGTATYRISNTQSLEMIDKYPEIGESVGFVKSLPHIKGLYKSKFTFLHIILAKKHAEMADEFTAKLFTGENLVKGSPVLTLRNKLFNLIGHRGPTNGHPHDHFLFAISIKAWNAFRSKRTAKVLSWGETEPPPKIR